MGVARVIVGVTCLVVAGLGGWVVLARWDQANKVASVASALGAVAAVGVAVWAALRPVSEASRGSVRLRDSGKARAVGDGSTANTGVRGTVAGLGGPVVVDRTGDAEASDGGDANTGVRID